MTRRCARQMSPLSAFFSFRVEGNLHRCALPLSFAFGVGHFTLTLFSDSVTSVFDIRPAKGASTTLPSPTPDDDCPSSILSTTTGSLRLATSIGDAPFSHKLYSLVRLPPGPFMPMAVKLAKIPAKMVEDDEDVNYQTRVVASDDYYELQDRIEEIET